MNVAKWVGGVLVMSATAAQAVPIVEWNTVSFAYNYDPLSVSFSLYTESSMGVAAACWGDGERETDGWWTTLHEQSGLIGIAFRFFEVNYGEAVDLNRSQTSAIVFGNDSWDHDPFRLDWDQPVYLGFRLGWPESEGALGAEYGWAQLYFDGETVSVLDSATERTGLGIVAGTGQAIPEPATAGLVLAGATALAVRRRKG